MQYLYDWSVPVVLEKTGELNHNPWLEQSATQRNICNIPVSGHCSGINLIFCVLLEMGHTYAMFKVEIGGLGWSSTSRSLRFYRNLNTIRSINREHGNLVDRYTIMARRYVRIIILLSTCMYTMSCSIIMCLTFTSYNIVTVGDNLANIFRWKTLWLINFYPSNSKLLSVLWYYV